MLIAFKLAKQQYKTMKANVSWYTHRQFYINMIAVIFIYMFLYKYNKTKQYMYKLIWFLEHSYNIKRYNGDKTFIKALTNGFI